MNELKILFSRIIGKPLFRITSGGGSGSIVVFVIGQKDAVLFIKCAWRLELNDKVITSSNENSKALSGDIPKNISKLIGLFIREVSIGEFYDLKLRFSEGWSMSIFCDITSQHIFEALDENWSLCFPDDNICYTLDKNFKIIKEKYY
ncbi:MAG TPA: hypothetical protein ENJ95_20415 [Bacteroidetes bacterium]|nr:hypothetical protein [Bacteroidota bacterium]